VVGGKDRSLMECGFRDVLMKLMLQQPLNLPDTASFRILVVSNPDNKAAVDGCRIIGEAIRGGGWLTWGKKGKTDKEKVRPVKGVKVEGCGFVCQCYSESIRFGAVL